MTNGNLEGQIFLFHPHTNNSLFFLLTIKYHNFKFIKRSQKLLDTLRCDMRLGLLGPGFCGGLVCGLGKIVGSSNFQCSSLGWFPIKKNRLKHVFQQTVWWSTQSLLATLLSSLIARRWVGLQTL